MCKREPESMIHIACCGKLEALWRMIESLITQDNDTQPSTTLRIFGIQHDEHMIKQGAHDILKIAWKYIWLHMYNIEAHHTKLCTKDIWYAIHKRYATKLQAHSYECIRIHNGRTAIGEEREWTTGMQRKLAPS